MGPLFFGGCATTLGVLGPRTVFTSSDDRVEPVGETQTRLRDGYIEDGRVVCEAETRSTRERSVHRHYGYDEGGRIALGFIGGGELLLGGAIAGSFAAEWRDQPEDWAALIGGALLAADGIVTVLLAALLDDFAEESVSERDGRWSPTPCPDEVEVYLGDVRVEAPGLRIPVESAAWTATTELSLRLGGGALSVPLDDATRCALDPRSCGAVPAPPRRIDLSLELPSLPAALDVEIETGPR